MRIRCYMPAFTILAAIGFLTYPVSALALSSLLVPNPQNTLRSAPPRIVTDEIGRQVTIPVDVRRIVSLAPSITEMIYALKLDDRLAGDTDYCNVPAAARSKPHVGSVMNPNLEAIVALHPDVVLAVAYSGNRRETVEALQQAGVAVYVIDPRTVLKMLDSMSDIAKLAGADKEGNMVVSQLRSKLEDLQKRLADRPLVHVLFVVWLDPLQTIGQHTFIADALRYAGAESIVLSKVDWPKLSLEEVVRLQPDYIVMANDEMNASIQTLKDLRARAVWKDLSAVQEGHVAIVSEEIDKPAPGLIDAIEQLARQIHPNLFSASEIVGNGEKNVVNSAGIHWITFVAKQNSRELVSCAR